MRRFSAVALAALLALVVTPAASASRVERHAPPRPDAPTIVNGTQANPGEYPAQAYIQIEKPAGTFSCGGTLVGTRQILTAAHCVTQTGVALGPSSILVLLGDNDLAAPNDDVYGVVANDVNTGWNPVTFSNDTAMLTLDRPASAYPPMRVADTTETSIWAPGDVMRIIGWGTTCSSGCSGSRFLLEANVPIIPDSRCADAYNSFDASLMVCAADPTGTPTANAHDTCQGDSGGPLLAADADGFFATVGVVSFGNGCADPDFPGVYARIGADPLHAWVDDRIPHASFAIDHDAVATQPVTLSSTSTDPDGPGYFTQFQWDTDADGAFDDATGASITQTYPAAGEQVVGLEASRPGGDVARFYGAFNVAPAPPPPPVVTPAATTSTVPTVTPPAKGPKGKFTVPSSLRAPGGRFSLKLTFAPTTPAGTAVLVVLAGNKKIGTVRVPVRPGKTVTAKVKLTKAGRRLLNQRGKLKVKLQLTVNGAVAKRALTLRR
jgi:secreted trypsin-like serine protease